jgi:hypothetical protein
MTGRVHTTVLRNPAIDRSPTLAVEVRSDVTHPPERFFYQDKVTTDDRRMDTRAV